jgi:hypothetical protein
MITDATTLQSVRDGWDFVRHSRNVTVGNCNVATWAIGFNQSGIRDLCFNLLLASAFSVLEETLDALRGQGVFSSKTNSLGALMGASQSSIPWLNWALIDKGRNKRNQSIHDRIFLPHAACRDYIAAIEQELVTWHVLTSATPELWHW